MIFKKQQADILFLFKDPNFKKCPNFNFVLGWELFWAKWKTYPKKNVNQTINQAKHNGPFAQPTISLGDHLPRVSTPRHRGHRSHAWGYRNGALAPRSSRSGKPRRQVNRIGGMLFLKAGKKKKNICKMCFERILLNCYLLRLVKNHVFSIWFSNKMGICRTFTKWQHVLIDAI